MTLTRFDICGDISVLLMTLPTRLITNHNLTVWLSATVSYPHCLRESCLGDVAAISTHVLDLPKSPSQLAIPTSFLHQFLCLSPWIFQVYGTQLLYPRLTICFLPRFAPAYFLCNKLVWASWFLQYNLRLFPHLLLVLLDALQSLQS